MALPMRVKRHVDLAQLLASFNFYRGVQGPRHSVGTGMGLAITRGLLAAERGRVWAENRLEGGARLSIQVPAPSHRAPVAGEP
jgi:signal transduction histidine kinase